MSSIFLLQAKIATDNGRTFTFNIHDPEYDKVVNTVVHSYIATRMMLLCH